MVYTLKESSWLLYFPAEAGQEQCAREEVGAISQGQRAMCWDRTVAVEVVHVGRHWMYFNGRAIKIFCKN